MATLTWLKPALVLGGLLLMLSLVWYLGDSSGAARVQAKWDVASLQWEQEQAKAAESYSFALAKARTLEQTWAARLQQVEETSYAKLRDIEARAAAAVATAQRLRDEGKRIAATLNRLPGSAAPACLNIARAATDAIGECGTRYIEMAAKHDHCERERQTLIASWPIKEEAQCTTP